MFEVEQKAPDQYEITSPNRNTLILAGEGAIADFFTETSDQLGLLATNLPNDAENRHTVQRALQSLQETAATCRENIGLPLLEKGRHKARFIKHMAALAAFHPHFFGAFNPRTVPQEMTLRLAEEALLSQYPEEIRDQVSEFLNGSLDSFAAIGDLLATVKKSQTISNEVDKNLKGLQASEIALRTFNRTRTDWVRLSKEFRNSMRVGYFLSVVFGGIIVTLAITYWSFGGIDLRYADFGEFYVAHWPKLITAITLFTGVTVATRHAGAMRKSYVNAKLRVGMTDAFIELGNSGNISSENIDYVLQALFAWPNEAGQTKSDAFTAADIVKLANRTR